MKNHPDNPENSCFSGCGGDVEVFHPMELERSQNTGLPIRGTVVTVFGGKDTVTGIKAVEGGGWCSCGPGRSGPGTSNPATPGSNPIPERGATRKERRMNRLKRDK
ncbi:hypothetical protein OESDEN_06549 [Oesophagostomum dentatum]|uniref:Uncharacterized protein n=1 Tax=Oesophagostomum dentatum TaxID=61180 RepID=A0A0B1TBM8_OESDE|nr:hypothetical protein OESDEN_06549 [Oesophagostomum dentatum]